MSKQKLSKETETKPELYTLLGTVKCGDIVRYPIGWNLSVKKVYEDGDGDLYVKESINTKDEYKKYLFKSMKGYKWDTRLCKELGFGMANKDELKYLED